MLAYPDDEIIIFDPAGEYGNLIEALGGVNVRLAPDADTALNPFDLADVEGRADAAQLAFKIDAFLALSSAMMAESSEGLPEADKSIITRCVEAAYARCSGGEGMPTLSDFHEILVEQPEAEARDIALRYERYVTGALSFFNRQSNVGFDNRITNIDLHDLSTNMRVFGMLTALEAVRNRMYVNFERGVTTWLYIDEVQSLFGHPTIIDYFAKFWAEGRNALAIRCRARIHRRIDQSRRGTARRRRGARADTRRLPQGQALRPLEHQARGDRAAEARPCLRVKRKEKPGLDGSEKP